MDLSLYIHIPFCRAKCAYCDFNSYAGRERLLEPYLAAVEGEIADLGARVASYQPAVVPTVYFGGGTPSLLSLGQAETLLLAVRRSFPVRPDAEVTLEANPGTVSTGYLLGLRSLGVNRLSLGVQSLDDGLLQAVGRIHTAAQARQAYSWARQAGFQNVSLDFMYGLPGQTLTQWQNTLQEALALCPDHLSLYALTVDEDTPLGRRVATGELAVPDADLAADMYELAEEVLAKGGYQHYEISNWAGDAERPWAPPTGSRCRHNLVYWRNEPYLGFGAGAHSSCPAVLARHLRPNLWSSGESGAPPVAWTRWRDALSPERYIACLRSGRSPAEEAQELSAGDAMAETMFMGLRLVSEGVPMAGFAERFDRSMEEVFGTRIGELVAAGLLESAGDRVRLTGRGRLLGNEVFQRFV